MGVCSMEHCTVLKCTALYCTVLQEHSGMSAAGYVLEQASLTPNVLYCTVLAAMHCTVFDWSALILLTVTAGASRDVSSWV